MYVKIIFFIFLVQESEAGNPQPLNKIFKIKFVRKSKDKKTINEKNLNLGKLQLLLLHI